MWGLPGELLSFVIQRSPRSETGKEHTRTSAGNNVRSHETSMALAMGNVEARTTAFSRNDVPNSMHVDLPDPTDFNSAPKTPGVRTLEKYIIRSPSHMSILPFGFPCTTTALLILPLFDCLPLSCSSIRLRSSLNLSPLSAFCQLLCSSLSQAFSYQVGLPRSPFLIILPLTLHTET